MRFFGSVTCVISLHPNDTMAKLKTQVRKEARLLSGILSLYPPRINKGDFTTIREYRFFDMCTVDMDIDFTIENVQTVLNVPLAYLDLDHFFDFTVVRDVGTTIVRGGEVYRRPYGWFKYALKVSWRYDNNCWLGSAGHRNAGSSAEWPVSYHGTMKENIAGIVREGYKLSRCRTCTHGDGIYTTPRVDIAARYAREFTHAGKTYKVVLQNRVNPATVRKVQGMMTFTPNLGSVSGPIWISPQEDDVRPYGILIKLVSDSAIQ